MESAKKLNLTPPNTGFINTPSRKRSAVSSSDDCSSQKCQKIESKSTEILQTFNQIQKPDEKLKLLQNLVGSLNPNELAKFEKMVKPILMRDILSGLPRIISLKILSYLIPETLLQCSLVSKKWNRLAEDELLWQDICQNFDKLDDKNNFIGSKFKYLSHKRTQMNWLYGIFFKFYF